MSLLAFNCSEQENGLEENTPIEQICDAVEIAHARIQKDFKHINPVVAVNRKMRSAGIAADIMTIDCLQSGRRILIVVHDALPETADYQFCLRDEEPHDEFERIALDRLTAEQLYTWMRDTFNP